jgi:glycosyltransferase involved in cell wall biosynthesis
MKILIVDTVSYDRAPYLKYYEDACKEQNVDYELFLWDRYADGGLEKQGNCFLYHKHCPLGGGKLRKILPMYLYRKTLLETIKHNQYTHLILINTLASVMISSYVLKHFNKKYIMDIRDYTYERFKSYKNIVDKLIGESCFTTISSEGFYKFLKKSDNIVKNHNISNVSEQKEKPTLSSMKTNTIGFVGSVRYERENLELIKALKHNENYVFLYYGQAVSGCHIEEKAREMGAKNIKFFGNFDNNRKANIYDNIDIINSLYGNSSLEVTTAVPNRYYDALLFKKPIIASKGTYLGEMVKNKRLGIVIDVFNDNIERLLNDFVINFDSQNFLKCCNRELSQIVKEQNYFYSCIINFIKEQK